MKLFSILAVAASLAFPLSVHSQTNTVVAAVAVEESLPLLTPDQIPSQGTFWLVMSNLRGTISTVPLPWLPLGSGGLFNVYGITSDEFLVDETTNDISTMNTNAIAAQATQILKIVDLVQSVENPPVRAMAMGIAIPFPVGTNGDSGNYLTNEIGYIWDTNQLWLQITNLTSDLAFANLYNATNQVYAIWSTTDLVSWQVETEVWPANTNCQPFTVSTLNRPDLYLRAEDWTGVTENGNTTPDWWFWMYFETTALSDTNLDGQGNTLLYDYQHGITPNIISFSVSFPSQYTSANSVDGAITLLSGLPSGVAVLVDSTNFTAAAWSAYTSSNLTVNLGSAQGIHDVWVGLRASPNDPQPIWEETALVLDTVTPTIAITSPSNSVSFNVSRVNVSGNFTAASLNQITVNGIVAFVNGTNFEALNVPLNGGTNAIVATLEDLTGLTNTTQINVIALTNADGSLNDPVELQATPIAGFAPLPVAFSVQANAPGTMSEIVYDFNGDDILDFVTNSVGPVSYTYATNGEYFPVVTIQTTAGRFSSIGGWNAMALDLSNQPIQINVQPALTQTIFASITDPVDLKWTGADLYVLSGSTATITEYAANGTAIRSLSGIGSNPSGLDVDGSGNVYVAITGNNQVWRFIPTNSTFIADTNFGVGGFIGSTNEAAGSDTNEFDAPSDVAVSPDGGTISVSDSGNDRIQQFATADGSFLSTFGTNGIGVGEFSDPKGLSYDTSGTLYIVDSGNNRIITAQGDSVEGESGTNGTALGEFNGPANVSVGGHGIYVADTGNNRVQCFNLLGNGVYSFNASYLRLALSTNLSGPYSVAAMDNLTNETFYIADTGNNRVLLETLAADDPTAAWTGMIAQLTNGNVSGAMQFFSVASAGDYQQTFYTLGVAGVTSAMNQAGSLTPVYIKNDTAEYFFTNTIDGQVITFPVDFDKENGIWKILEF